MQDENANWENGHAMLEPANRDAFFEKKRSAAKSGLSCPPLSLNALSCEARMIARYTPEIANLGGQFHPKALGGPGGALWKLEVLDQLALQARIVEGP